MLKPKVEQALYLKTVPQLPFYLEVYSFLADCQARALSANTLRIYRHNLHAFQGWSVKADVEEVTASDLRAYLNDLQDAGHNAGGVHQAYRVLKTFFRWLVSEGVLSNDPMARVKPPKLRKSLLEPLDMAELRAMLATCGGKTFTDVRDKAILLCLLDTGCRASEFVALDVADVNLNTGAVHVHVGKGGKGRVVFLGAKARRELARYLRLRPDGGALWLTDDGQRLTYAGLRQVVRRRAMRAGLDKEPSLHAFRRSFALLSLRNGCDVYSLQKLMGHADLTVLRRYLAQTEGDLQQAHERSGPVDRWL